MCHYSGSIRDLFAQRIISHSARSGRVSAHFILDFLSATHREIIIHLLVFLFLFGLLLLHLGFEAGFHVVLVSLELPT